MNDAVFRYFWTLAEKAIGEPLKFSVGVRRLDLKPIRRVIEAARVADTVAD
jgi:hypothetical protein